MESSFIVHILSLLAYLPFWKVSNFLTFSSFSFSFCDFILQWSVAMLQLYVSLYLSCWSSLSCEAQYFHSPAWILFLSVASVLVMPDSFVSLFQCEIFPTFYVLLSVPEYKGFPSSPLSSCFMQSGIAGPAGPAKAGPLFSKSLVSFSDCRDSLRTKRMGQVSHASSPLPCMYVFLVIILPVDQEHGAARPDCIGTHAFWFHK